MYRVYTFFLKKYFWDESAPIDPLILNKTDAFLPVCGG